MASVDDAFSLAQSLSPADQQVLIQRLLAAQPEEAAFTPPASHLAEVDRRWEAYKAGKLKAVPWEEVWAEVNAELGLND